MTSWYVANQASLGAHPAQYIYIACLTYMSESIQLWHSQGPASFIDRLAFISHGHTAHCTETGLHAWVALSTQRGLPLLVRSQCTSAMVTQRMCTETGLHACAAPQKCSHRCIGKHAAAHANACTCMHIHRHTHTHRCTHIHTHCACTHAAYRKLAGKELAEDATFDLERRRNRPEKYDREVCVFVQRPRRNC